MKKGRRHKRLLALTNSAVVYSRESMGVYKDRRISDIFWMHMPVMETAHTQMIRSLTRITQKQPRKWAVRITVYCKGYAKHSELAVQEPISFEELENFIVETQTETINECNAKDIINVEWIATPFTKEAPDDIRWAKILKRVDAHDKRRSKILERVQATAV